MATRPALALAAPRSLLPGGPRIRRSAVVVAVVVAAVLVGAYATARWTGAFAVQSIDVEGAPPQVAAAVEQAAREARGQSLVTLDQDALERELVGLPWVVSAQVDRAFPDTLRIRVQAERPAAVMRSGANAWLVSERGRVVGRADPRRHAKLPRIWLPSATPIAPGTTLDADHQGAAVRALALLPRSFPLRVDTARSEEDGITLVLGNRSELRLGLPDDLELKMAAAARTLRELGAPGRAALSYVDASVPERVVVAENSQVEG